VNEQFDADWQDQRRRALLLGFLGATEEEPAFIGTRHTSLQ
jgi:hypothetical protein